MNKQTLNYLEERENLHLDAVVELTKNTDMSFEEAERTLDLMATEVLTPINTDFLTEVAVDKSI